MSNDPLYFLKDPTPNAAGVTGYPTGNLQGVSVNPVHFITNILLVLLLIYLTILILKFFLKNKAKPQSYLLKEVVINQNLKILFIKISKKLYLIANSNNQLMLMDTIKEQKEILQILTEHEEDEKKAGPLPGFNLFKKKTKLPDHFENTLKNIIKNSGEIEELNKK